MLPICTLENIDNPGEVDIFSQLTCGYIYNFKDGENLAKRVSLKEGNSSDHLKWLVPFPSCLSFLLKIHEILALSGNPTNITMLSDGSLKLVIYSFSYKQNRLNNQSNSHDLIFANYGKIIIP